MEWLFDAFLRQQHRRVSSFYVYMLKPLITYIKRPFNLRPPNFIAFNIMQTEIPFIHT